ncbi:MAG: extracellular solute-binding protein [Candidatus Enterosoma sp.]|nr:extracellular solute-binding protein [Candidatus Enterosoma sp.]MDY4549959.1 extracellular solute-binding protein [Candidatus Enterosoma sp.]
MSQHRLIKLSLFLASVGLIASDSFGLLETSVQRAKVFFAEKGDTITLNVYNWEDYIAEDDTSTEEEEDDLVKMFEDYCLEKYGQKVEVIYSTFDTNETMLAQIDLGKSFDLVCPSDYTIQKMIAKDMVVPFDEANTPNYNKYVSPFVIDKIKEIEVKGEKNIVNQYARGYMWGTLGILYNNTFGMLPFKGISQQEMDEDMNSWLSLWDEKYQNLLAIKDSMRDTYAAGIFMTYNNDFTTSDGVTHDGLQTLKNKYDKGTIDADTYNREVTRIFNMCDDETINAVEKDLKTLRENAFGFEVDSGKVDMAQGNKFAINLAWSGDAAWAMDMADEYNDEHYDEETEEYEEGFNPTLLKYAIPETGANIWFDGWVMPKTISEKNKIWAERFVDFLSMPKNAAINMEFIGYTPVIAGDAILELVQSWYDIRFDEESEEMNDALLDDYDLVDMEDIPDLTYLEDGTYNEDIYNYAYSKDISYFFASGESNTLEEHDISEATFYISGDSYLRQFDTQYPDASLLPGLAVMADFGEQNQKIITMWEHVKNTALPLWAYILIIVAILLIIGLVIFRKVQVASVKKRRKERKKEREMRLKQLQQQQKAEKKKA